jgi:hypothetical protein
MQKGCPVRAGQPFLYQLKLYNEPAAAIRWPRSPASR